jgi:hypothetical protein
MSSMMTTLALVAALSLSPAQGSGLTLGNPRLTYGELGTTRPDNKYLPGDICFLSFDIEGLKVADTGMVRYSIAMEVFDSSNKSIFKQQPVEQDGLLPLGGSKLPGRAYVSIDLAQAPGIYTLRVSVIDMAPKMKEPKTIEQKFEVLPKQFGMVAIYLSADQKGDVPAPLVGISGQMTWIHFVIIDFDRDKTTKQPSITLETVIYDKDRKPTLEKPMVTNIPSDPNDPMQKIMENQPGIPMRIPMPLNREGGYLIEIKCTDNLTKKTSKVYLPLRVYPAN